MTHSTDCIEKQIVLRASLSRVWSAITDSKQFGAWFGVEFESEFTAGAHIQGKIVPTKADAEIAKSQEPYSGTPFQVFVVRIDPMHTFAFRWHPYAVEPGQDYTKEPTTLVTFELRETPDGTLLTITESGFDQIPLERRAQAFTQNEQGWTAQTQLIQKYLEQVARGEA
ncbi:MAG: SRPBCC family protein [Povalibacter sp.]